MTEPEEIVESKLVALLATAAPAIDTLGALSPASEGVEKLSPDTSISVFADVASQDLDWQGHGVPFTYSVRIVVRVADADDKTGLLFRDTCRSVRSALAALMGDRCSALDGDGFHCDAFVLGATETSRDLSSESGGMAKTYTATVTGRYIPPTENQEES